ncbi:hypothetical protein BDE02_05G031800 [Populus trichocarpa]|nr:hypothetical protein BDE02_05G031800 [Populus trichocarpa]
MARGSFTTCLRFAFVYLNENRYRGTFAFMKINVEMSKNNRLIRV